MKKMMVVLVVSLVFIATQSVANVSSIASFGYADWATDGWTQIIDDNAVDGSITTPGGGGQEFDAEYLFYKLDEGILSVGLQTGFNLQDGEQEYSSKMYYAGDLALSFDGSVDNGYEYAFDFGFSTKNYNGIDVGGQADPAGLYKNVTWNENNDIYFRASNPFAMSTGTLVASVDGGAATNSWGSFVTDLDLSYYRQISFDLANIENISGLDIHWTMSCGNDAIDGSAPVPEPATLILLGSGLAGLAFYRRKKK